MRFRNNHEAFPERRGWDFVESVTVMSDERVSWAASPSNDSDCEREEKEKSVVDGMREKRRRPCDRVFVLSSSTT